MSVKAARQKRTAAVANRAAGDTLSNATFAAAAATATHCLGHQRARR